MYFGRGTFIAATPLAQPYQPRKGTKKHKTDQATRLACFCAFLCLFVAILSSRSPRAGLALAEEGGADDLRFEFVLAARRAFGRVNDARFHGVPFGSRQFVVRF